MKGGSRFKSPDKKYRIENIKTTERPFSPSPKTKDFEKLAQTESDKHSRCTFINAETNRRCKLHLGLYPKFCHLHTLLITNLYIADSNIKNAGKGLFSGPYGFKKHDIIGEYSEDWIKLKYSELEKRNGPNKLFNTSYVYCDAPKDDKNENCYDALDIRTTLMRFINDSHGNSKYKNNVYFSSHKGHVYIKTSKNIQPFEELFLDYGAEYW